MDQWVVPLPKSGFCDKVGDTAAHAQIALTLALSRRERGRRSSRNRRGRIERPEDPTDRS